MPVSHLLPAAVQRDMMHSLKTALAILPATALISIVCACGPVVDVLHDTDAGAATGGSGATNGTPTTGGASSSTGTTTTGGSTGTPVCGALSSSNIDAVVQGQPCSDTNLCDPGGCLSTAINNDPNAPAAALVTCRAGQAEVLKMTAIDRPASGVRNDGVTWDDCASALESGLSGQACTFTGKSCVRKASDPCCLEGIQCRGMTATSATIDRVSLCAPNCENLQVTWVPPTPIIGNCATAASSVADCHKMLSCADGRFICSGMAGSSDSIHTFDASDNINSAMWCAGGILVGGYGFTWGV